MNEHLNSILITLQRNQDLLFVAYICVGALTLKAKGLEIVESRTLLCVAGGLGVLVSALYLMTLVNYLRYPSYLDHVEATVVSIAWLGMHGHPFYPNWATDDVYGLVYGPALYLLHGLFLLIDPTIAMSKALGVVSLLIFFGAIFIVVRKKVDNNLTSLLFIASLVMLFVPFGPFAYWTRAEPFLILISALALLVAIRIPPFAAAAIIGALAGLAADFKLHGFIYVAPMAIMTLARARTPGDRVIHVIVGIACAVVIALLPFCLKQSSLVGYWQYLNIAAKHELYPSTFNLNLLVVLVLCAPAVAIWLRRKPAINPAEFWLLVGLCISIAIAAVIGSVSGPYHLLPFVPLCLYAAVVVSGAAEARRIIAIIFLLLVVAYGPGAYVLNHGLQIDYYRNSQNEREKITELQTYLKSYPDAQVGISDNEHDSDTNYRIVSVLQGHPLHVDFVAWEDLAYVGVPEKDVIRFIKTCEVPKWILPLGPPFTKLSWYTKRPMLSDDFRKTFATNYRLVEMGRTYQVWGCRSSSEGPSKTELKSNLRLANSAVDVKR